MRDLKKYSFNYLLYVANMSNEVDFGSLGTFAGVGAHQLTKNEAMSTALDLFSDLDKETTMMYDRECVYRPVSAITNHGPYHFRIPAENAMMIDTTSIQLEGVVSVKKKNTATGALENLESTDKVSVCNMFAPALFSTIEVSLNGALVSFVNSPQNQYRDYIETTCSYSHSAASSHLRSYGFLMDTADHFEKESSDKTDGITKRSEWIKESKKFDFCFPLSADVLRLDRYLPDKLDLDLKITRTNDDFSLLALPEQAKDANGKPETNSDGSAKMKKPEHGKYVIVFHELCLHVRKIGMGNDYLKAMDSKLQSGMRAKYPLIRSVIKTRTIPAGDMHADMPNLFTGRLPNTMIVGFVDSRAFNGAIDKNPFYFQHFNMTDIWVDVNSKSYPTARYTPDFENGLYMRMYRSLFDNVGIKHHNEGLLINHELFGKGCTFATFDFTPDKCQNFHIHYEKKGTAGLKVNFKTALEQGITAIIYATFNDIFELDEDRIAYSTTSVSG